MKQEIRYLISDAARKVAVESHVLRYWEEELKLPIKRNELGHRYYTEEDILCFQEVKTLKEQGLQLKAIRMILKGGKLESLTGWEIAAKAEFSAGKDIPAKPEPFTGREINTKAESYTGREMGVKAESYTGREFNAKAESREKETKHILMVNSNDIMSAASNEPTLSESREAKSLRLQQLLQQMISEAVRTNNRELCDDIRETLLKELDYQFRLQEEREEERIREQLDRDDLHYHRIDELIRNRNKKPKPEKARKKPNTKNTGRDNNDIIKNTLRTDNNTARSNFRTDNNTLRDNFQTNNSNTDENSPRANDSNTNNAAGNSLQDNDSGTTGNSFQTDNNHTTRNNIEVDNHTTDINISTQIEEKNSLGRKNKNERRFRFFKKA